MPFAGGRGQEIVSARHPAIAAVQRLRRPQARRAARVCLAEGPHLVREALEARLQPLAVFATERWLDGPEGRELATVLARRLGPLPPVVEVPPGLHRTSEQAFRRLADTPSPQGVLAVFALPEPAPAAALPLWTLVLDGVQDPGNVGTLARALLAFCGAGALLLTGPGTADPFGEKALRASAGAVFRLSHRHAAQEELPAVLKALAAGGVRLWALHPRAGTALPEADLRPPAALVVGSEGRGVSAQTLALCRPLTVPMPGPAESLNAALAGAIALYEAAGRAPRA